jgi:hypothetical protein
MVKSFVILPMGPLIEMAKGCIVMAVPEIF